MGLIASHERLGALNANGHLVLGLSSGVGRNTRKKHEMVQRYGYQGNFRGVGRPKIHHEKQRSLKRSEQSYPRLENRGMFLRER